MVKVCEACGHPVNDFEIQLKLTPRQRDMYRALQKAGQRGLLIQELINKVYADEPDGGPMTANNVVQVQKMHMQKKLSAFGLQITTTRGHGAIWRLEAL